MRARATVSTFTAAVAVLAVAACGGDDGAQTTEADVIAKLTPALKLHEYASVENSFTVPPGRPDVHLGEDGNECWIDDVAVGDDVASAKGDEGTLVAPDEGAAVRVKAFMGTPRSVCLDAARDVLGW